MFFLYILYITIFFSHLYIHFFVFFIINNDFKILIFYLILSILKYKTIKTFHHLSVIER